eukprot:gene8897-9816_t
MHEHLTSTHTSFSSSSSSSSNDENRNNGHNSPTNNNSSSSGSGSGTKRVQEDYRQLIRDNAYELSFLHQRAAATVDPYVVPNSVDIPSVQHENASEHEPKMTLTSLMRQNSNLPPMANLYALEAPPSLFSSNSLSIPHGQQCVEVNSTNLTNSIRVQATFHWNQIEQIKILQGKMTELDYYKVMFPMEECYPEILSGTNEILRREVMAIDPRPGCRQEYWREESIVKSVLQPAKFVLAMLIYNSNTTTTTTTSSSSSSLLTDPWHAIRSFVDGFNNRRALSLTPGKIICVEESMGNWSGLELKYTLGGLPFSSKQPRKPTREC